MNLAKLTDSEQQELFELLEQEKRELVSPKMERFREPWRIKLAHGGRGAGAKSWSVASLLIQRAHRERLRIGCFREVQKSLEESSYRLMVDTINRLQYPGWSIRRESLDSPTGSHIIFRGLVDIRASNQVKGLEGYNLFWLEEAATISSESIRMLLPTLRKEGSELWATWNRESEVEAVFTDLWCAGRDDMLRVELEQGKIDNPWFPDILQAEMEADYKRNPDEAIHTWGGQPRKQGFNAILNRVDVRNAMERKVEGTEPEELGVDVARFGDDTTQIYRRRGFKTVEHREYAKLDTQVIAREAWEMAGRDRRKPIKVDDTGVGGGVTDRLRALGANVIAVNFGGKSGDTDKYETAADEMWFEFEKKIHEVEIPNDPELFTQLTGRLYGYDKRERRKVESKTEYKKRWGRSPDKADALLLAYYNPKRNISSVGASRLLGV
jgi:phage terminase large subunit